MSYCVQCGVELGAGEARCPLCHTPVCRPAPEPDPAQRPYPAFSHPREEPVSRTGALFLCTALFVLPLVICFLCDLLLNGRLTWFHYVAGSLLFLYAVLVLPLWFRRPRPVLFVAADFAAAALFLRYLEWSAGGSWFLPFALPAVCGAMVIAVTVTALARRLRGGLLYLCGGAVVAVGAYAMLVELLLNRTFHLRERLLWSYFPMAACLLLGAALIVIAGSPRLRAFFHRRFFL